MQDKNRLKQLLFGLELRSTAIIVNGLVHKVPKRTVLNQIRKELLVSNRHIHLNSVEIGALYDSLVARYTKLSRKTYSSLKTTDLDYKEKLLERQDAVYDVVRSTVLEEMEHDKNTLANVVEQRFKSENLSELTRNGVFFLCSSHIKPAKDHEDWEGKVYVAENWEARVNDAHEKARIEAYIDENDVRTVEWVTGPPVYMIYRPNCKHYFIPVSVEEVLGSSEKELLVAHKLYMPEDLPISYEKSCYKAYYERLKALHYFKKMCPSNELNKDIKRTRKLLLKWAARARAVGK